MFVSILRSLAAVVAGLAVAIVLVVAVELASSIFHPFPVEADTTDPEVVSAHVAIYPHWLLAVAAACWAITTFLSVWVATRFGSHRHPAHGIVVGFLLATAVAVNLWMLPYYLWFKAVNFIAIPLAVFVGVKIASAKK